MGTSFAYVTGLRPISRRRSLRSYAQRIWGAVSSRGVGYEPQPPGSRYTQSLPNQGYFVDLTAKVESESAEPAECRAPAGLAQLALGYYERYLCGDDAAVLGFQRCCDLLRRRGEDTCAGVLWPYQMPVPKYRLEPPWYSAMAQGQVASVFVRAAHVGGDDTFADLALRAIDPLVGRSAGLVTDTVHGPVLEEAPTHPPSQILNGWIYALWGLWDVAHGIGYIPAADLLAKTVECLRKELHRYDTGWWTRYSLYPHRTRDLAKPFYHRLHTTQVAVLYALYGHDEFRESAQRWAAYDRTTNRALALTQKAIFVALGR